MVPESKQEDLAVFRVRRRDSACDDCGEALVSGRLIRVVSGPDGAKQARCLPCAGLDDLSFVPTGDARLSRRVRARSERQAVVVQWARARKRYERQGYLVEQPVLDGVLEEFEEEGYELAFELKDGYWLPRG